jgi:heme-degrading monooxygenase HmoA
MSVMMGMVIEADPARFEQVAKDNAELMKSISAKGKQAGAISHQFFASKDSVLVVDEWPDEASFLGFFEASGAEIGSLMAQAGVTAQPTPNFWRPLDTADKF